MCLLVLFLVASTVRANAAPPPVVSQGTEKGTLIVRTAHGENGLIFRPSGRTPELTFISIAQTPSTTFPWAGFTATYPQYRVGLPQKSMACIGLVNVFTGELRFLWYGELTDRTLGALSWQRQGATNHLLVDFVTNGIGEPQRFNTTQAVNVVDVQCLNSYKLQQSGLKKILALWRQYRATPPDKRQVLLDRLCRPTLCAEMRQRYALSLARNEPFRREHLSVTGGPTWWSVLLSGRFLGESQFHSIQIDLDRGWLEMPYRSENEWGEHFDAGHDDDASMVYYHEQLRRERAGGR